MRLKLLFAFFLCLVVFFANAQDVVYYRNDPVSANWDWGGDCNSSSSGGNWSYSIGGGLRMRSDCFGFNRIIFNNAANTVMNLNSGNDFSANQIQFISGTPDRIINTDASRSLFFQNNNGNCKIENYVTLTTHTFNVPIIINSGGNNMEINPVNGFLVFNNSITNNSSNPINIYGAQQVTFFGDIIGSQGITLNNTATAVYNGVSKTYTGNTTINAGTLRISTNQTIGALALNGGTLQVDSGVTLTITGDYTATGGTINNLGTIKFAGGSVTFPGGATINNGTANTLTSIEAATTGTLILNSLVRATGLVTVSKGTLLLSGNNLRLNNANLNIAAIATFDTGGENQIFDDGNGSITISGTFITRDIQGFVGTNTAISSIEPALIAGCTIEYGLNGNQIVQGGRSYFNLTISNGGIKTLSSAITNTNSITGTVLIKDAAILDLENKSFGDSNTNLAMTGTSELRTAGTGVKPDIGGTYTLGIGTKITFTNTASTLEKIRLAPKYYNIDIVGTNIGTDTATGSLDFQTGGKLTVKSAGTFKLSNTTGFSGGTNTAISNVNNPSITLEAGSTVEYSGANQTISLFSPQYKNLTISGTGTKILGHPKDIYLDENLNVNASSLVINTDEIITINKAVKVVSPALFEIKNNGQLVQITNVTTNNNSGNIIYERMTTPLIYSDYTYWSSPVDGLTLGEISLNPVKFIGFLYYSYEVTAAYEDWKKEFSTTTMLPGKGYIVGASGYSGTPPMGPINLTAKFTGKPNNGQYKITGIIDNKSYLIGNPYPSAIDADRFLDTNSSVLDGTLYFWTHNTEIAIGVSNPGTGVYAYSQDDYASYNRTGGSGTAAAISGSGSNIGINRSIPTGKIAAGQGFFASSNLAIVGNKEVIFNNDMRLILNAPINNTQFFKLASTKTKTATLIEKNRIWLNLSNTQGAFKQTLLGYITGATNEYDNAFDGESFDGQEFIDFYSVNQDMKLVIQGRALPFDEADVVPLGFRSTIEGTFTIAIDHTDGFMANQTVFLEDKLTNTVFDLKSGNYNFTTVAGTFNTRFVLRYTSPNGKSLGANNVESIEKQILVSSKNKQIKINSQVESIDKVLVYDLLGRKIYQKSNVNSNELNILTLASSQQTLLVKVTLVTGQTVTRKIIF